MVQAMLCTCSYGVFDGQENREKIDRDGEDGRDFVISICNFEGEMTHVEALSLTRKTELGSLIQGV